MPVNRPLDHLVLCVHNLDAGRVAYERLGFTLTPKALHPFGTANSLVQLDGNFLELVTVADPRLITQSAHGSFSFAAFNQTYLAEREGMSMLVFASADARADQREFAASGLDTYAPFDFSRLARLPDGTDATVGFSLAFVTDPRMPRAAFFTCQQHAPQYFWKPEYQRHRNGAITVDEIVMVAAEPHALVDFFRKLQPGAAIVATGSRLAVPTARGVITVLDPAGFVARFPGSEPPALATPHFAAYRVRVDDVARAEGVLRENGVAFRLTAGSLQIDAEANFGAALEFAAGALPTSP